MNKLAFSLLLIPLTFYCVALTAAGEPDPRMARITDRADADSQVSNLVISNTDARFGFDKSDDNGRIVVATRSVELAIPIQAITAIDEAGNETWDVKYQTTNGEALASGELAATATLSGNSEFGVFTLPLVRLKHLVFQQPGAAATPAKRPPIFGSDGHIRSDSFTGVLTFTDGSRLPVASLRRNEVYASQVTDPSLLTQPLYALVCSNYTDFRLIRGETLQIIPFENVKSVQFFPDDAAVVKTVRGAEANMKLPVRSDETLEGFTGASIKGDFYVPLKLVTSIALGDDTTPAVPQKPATDASTR